MSKILHLVTTLLVVIPMREAVPVCDKQSTLSKDTVNIGRFWTTNDKPLENSKDSISTSQKVVKIDVGMNNIVAGTAMKAHFNMVKFKVRVRKCSAIELSCHDSAGTQLDHKDIPTTPANQWRKYALTYDMINCYKIEIKFKKANGKPNMEIKAMTMNSCRVCKEITDSQLSDHLTKTVVHGPGLWRRGTCVRFSCLPNFALFGDNETCCGNNRQWTNPIPTCERICDEITNSQLSDGVEKLVTHGSVEWGDNTCVSFTCPPDTVMVGDNKTCCDTTGATNTWTNQIPTCERVCPAITDAQLSDDVEKNEIHGSIEWSSETCVEFTCPTDSVLIGNNKTCCDTTGPTSRWTNEFPTCEKICQAITTADLSDGVTKTETHGNIEWGVGSCVTFECPPGKVPHVHNETCCDSSGQWTNPLPTCERVCPVITDSQIENGEVIATHGPVEWGNGTCIRVNCIKPGFYPVTAYKYDTICCRENGTWSDDTPRCVGTVFKSSSSYTIENFHQDRDLALFKFLGEDIDQVLIYVDGYMKVVNSLTGYWRFIQTYRQDYDTRLAGEIYYSFETDPAYLAKLDTEILTRLPNDSSTFNGTIWALWIDYCNMEWRTNLGPTSTFSGVFAVDSFNNSYIIWRYKELEFQGSVTMHSNTGTLHYWNPWNNRPEIMNLAYTSLIFKVDTEIKEGTPMPWP